MREKGEVDTAYTGVAVEGNVMSIRFTIRYSKKMKNDTVVTIGGDGGVTIPSAVLQSLPDPGDIDTNEPPKTLDIDGVEVTVIASDIQKSTSGWAVTLPPGYPFSGKRIKAELGENVRPSDMMYRETLKVDLTVYRDPSKDMRVTHVLIRSIHPAE